MQEAGTDFPDTAVKLPLRPSTKTGVVPSAATSLNVGDFLSKVAEASGRSASRVLQDIARLRP